MEIVLNRRGGIPVREQIATQLQLQILGGALAHGQRLPSVRALARRLRVHHNTVSAAYQDLQQAGHVQLKKGAGVYVRRAGPTELPEARGLDDMIRLALRSALTLGYTGTEIRAAVERWLAAAPPERVVIVDPSREMGELLVQELRTGLERPASTVTLDDVARDPRLLDGTLALVLPYHVEWLRQVAPAAAVEEVTLEVGEADRKAIVSLPSGSIVLVVSHAPAVLPFASVFLHSLRGDELFVDTRPLAAAAEWRRLAPAADLVLADVLAAPAARAAGARRVREVRVVPPRALERLREALTVVTPGS
jgi:DNA-binding transcriptional regulator YhcF (GntR family)